MATKCALFERLTLHTPHLSSARSIPAFIYGTAWKKEATTDLVYSALQNGFTAIDTAAQPKHYREDLVGEALRRAVKDKIVNRSDVFIQTKFTSVGGQDKANMPYELDVSVAEQVKQSIHSSLTNFRPPVDSQKVASGSEECDGNYLDSVVLHSPLNTVEGTMEAWQTLESFVPTRIHSLGISNVNLPILKYIYEHATIKPAVVQNRFYASTKYDVALRAFCRERNIVYQSFWTLSANPKFLGSQAVTDLQSRINIGPESALYCLVLGLEGTVILNGTTQVEHMRADLEAIHKVKEWAEGDRLGWEGLVAQFKRSIGQN